ncbi:MAG: glycosyltransferase family 2 protein [Acidobacteriota bacterium]|nr:glycosyltransferase family 2 protein [Blastocatellia bacterium]MDW8412472.1 glycosyltransferase family 2 protein [Acidobacteriota bacterium]
MYRGRKIAVVMPVHNERSLVLAALASVPDFVDWVVVVDDFSTDGSVDELFGLSAERVEIIRHGENLGVGASVKDGYKRALELGADIVAVMDGDGQMHPDDLQKLLDGVCDGFDYVKGNRFLDESIDKMPRIRYFGNRVLSLLMRLATGLEVDSQCGYTAIDRHLLQKLSLDEIYPRYGYLNSLLFQIVEHGASVGSAPVKTIYGKEISGINPFVTVPTILWIIFYGWFRSGVLGLLPKPRRC